MEDRTRTQAVLIYAPRYADPDLPDLPAATANVSDLAAVLTDPDLVGLPVDNVHLLYAADPITVATALADVAESAQGALLVYYAGHGVLGPNGKLYLATTTTTWHRVSFNGLDYEWIRQAILNTPAPTKVIIVDCCFSGRAIGTMAGQASVLASQLDVDGTYVITSTGPNDPASAPPGARNTAFTGELLEVLRNGIPNAGTEITLKEVYEQVERNLRAKGLPRPDTDIYRHADRMMLVRNAYVAGESPATQSVGEAPKKPRPRTRRAEIVAAVLVLIVVAALTVAVVKLSTRDAETPDNTDEARFTGTLSAVGDVRDVTFSPDGKILATAGGNDHTVLLWSMSTGAQTKILTGCCVVSAMAFSPDNKLVASDVETFSVATGQSLHELAAGGAYDVAFSPDGRLLATASGYEPSQGVRIHDPATGATIRVITTEYFSALAFSPDGKMLATASGYLNKGVTIWDPDSGKLVRTINGGSGNPVFSADGKFIATSGEETIGIWNPKDGDHIRDVDAVNALAFSPNGRLLLAAGKDRVVRLYDPATGKLVRTLSNVYAEAAAYSPDGERIATVSPDRTVRVVDVSR